MANRVTEAHKVWLFDLAHGNLSDSQILQGFVKYYILNGLMLANVQDDLVFRTFYGEHHVGQAMKSLREVLEKAVEGGGQ